MTAYQRSQVHRTYPLRDVIVHFDERQRRSAGREQGLTVGQLLQRIVTGARTGVAVVDNRGNLVFVNARARVLALVCNGQLDDRARVAAKRVLHTGEDEEIDLSPLRPEGRSGSAVRGCVRLLTERDRRFAVIAAEDDSEQLRLEATRRDFVANVSHELKTPVSTMSLLAEALLANVGDPETVYGFGEKIFAEAQRLGQMVSELIELSRLQGAESLPNLVPVDIDTVVAEAISRYKVGADTASIVISTDAPSGFKVLGDHALLVTALANLVSNAIAYSPPGSPVSISCRSCGDNVEIAVSDQGIGIAEADQERVFERFFRADKARSRSTGGTGLGLAIVKHVAANHNGTVKLWSQPGIGSTFTLAIPAFLDTDGISDPTKEMAGAR
ncbi:MAG: sensor histidine kinase [Mycobacterium sp.]|nr:sensor histidine kinase [Mycobacterium sp.]